MARTMVVVLLTCAVLMSLADAHAPSYVSSIQHTRSTHDYIAKKLTFQTPTPEQRGMTALTVIIYAVAGDILKGLSYEAAYSVEQITVEQRKQNANAERDTLLYTLDQTIVKIQPIINLVQILCNGGVYGSGAQCDDLVQAHVLSNPTYYEKPAALAIELGELSIRYDAIFPQIETASVQQTERQYLATSQNALRPVITQAARALKVFNSIP